MTEPSAEGLIACHECDHLYQASPIPVGGKAECHHCGALLYRNIPNSLNRALALSLTALLLFILANSYPFMSLELGGRIEENVLASGAWALYKLGMGELGLLVFFTSILFPLLTISGSLYLLLSLRLGYEPPAMGRVYRLVTALWPWSLVGVFMLGVLIAFVKLLDLANVIPGTSLFALAGLLVVTAAARANLDPAIIWPRTDTRHINLRPGKMTAAAQGLTSCHTCGLLTPMPHDHDVALHCGRCDTPLHPRKHDSLTRTWALVIAASLLLIPANVFPVMTVIRFGQGAPDTILSGVIHLIEDGMWGLAMIVFFASIVVPVMKLIILVFLLLSVHKSSTWRPRDRTLLYRVTEVVGAWSMVDIFLVGLLSALVSLDALATIRPGIGASFFAAVVVITMFAAHSFDPRLIWDRARAEHV